MTDPCIKSEEVDHIEFEQFFRDYISHKKLDELTAFLRNKFLELGNVKPDIRLCKSDRRYYAFTELYEVSQNIPKKLGDDFVKASILKFEEKKWELSNE